MQQIVQDGDPILRQEAASVPESLFDSRELAKILKTMAAALDREEDGVALAAPQIGVSYRIFIVRKDRTIPDSDRGSSLAPNPQGRTLITPVIDVYINPDITKTSRKRQKVDEGCLSVRGVYGTTNRHEKVALRARHEDGKRFTRGASGLMAQIFEHEIDHLNGVLFIDHADALIELKKHAPAAR